MKLVRSLPVLISLPLLLADCKKDNIPTASTCAPPTMLTAKAQCETGYAGALLKASGYTGSTMQFEYQVYVQPDTVSNDISPSKNAWANASNEQIIVPDAVVKNAPKFVVRVLVNCSGKLVPSRTFAFVKRDVAV
jgi:hypothetical protein